MGRGPWKPLIRRCAPPSPHRMGRRNFSVWPGTPGWRPGGLTPGYCLEPHSGVLGHGAPAALTGGIRRRSGAEGSRCGVGGAGVLDCASPLALLQRGGSESARGLAQSKTSGSWKAPFRVRACIGTMNLIYLRRRNVAQHDRCKYDAFDLGLLVGKIGSGQRHAH